MTTTPVSSGVASSGLMIGPGTDLQILHGGNATNIVISGGTEEVYGSESRLWVASQGSAAVESGGVVHSANLGSNAYLTVSSGGIISNASVSGGAELTISAGGDVVGLAVGGNASLGLGEVVLYGSASQVTAGSYSEVNVTSGASVSGLLLSGPYNYSEIAGSVTSLTDVGDNVTVGGVVSGANISDARVYDYGTIRGANVFSGGSVDLVGGTFEGVVYAQATLEIDGGSASAVITSGGSLGVGALAVGSGQSALYSATGVVSVLRTVVDGVTLSTGASLNIQDYYVSSGGRIVMSGGVVAGATESSGGRVNVNPSSAFTLGSSHPVYLLSGAYIDFENQTVLSAGELLLESGGIGVGTVISSGGLAAAWADSILDDSLAIGGGVSISGAGSLASGSVLESAGYEFAQAGGSSLAATVSNGGIDYAASGGLVSDAMILSDGVEIVEAGGFDSGSIVSLGGRLMVSSGGVAAGDTVWVGGAEIVKSSGIVSAAVVRGGGGLNVSAGGIVWGGLVLSGGTAIIAGTAASGQTISFTSTAVAILELDNLSGFSAAIAGMTQSNQKVDLSGFTYSSGEVVSWAQTGTSGTLTITDGAKVANLTLIGTYSSASFKLTNDGKGGTYVADLPLMAAANLFLQTAAGFGAGPGQGDNGPFSSAAGGWTGSAAALTGPAALSGFH
jgi:autotransporter passenger strand-loop-strand repeat protein